VIFPKISDDFSRTHFPPFGCAWYQIQRTPRKKFMDKMCRRRRRRTRSSAFSRPFCRR